MLNNEFVLVGIATTNLWKDKDADFPIYYIRVEVEKRVGKNKGIVNSALCKVYGRNTSVDFNAEYKGKVVSVNGYLDIRTSKDGISQFVSLIVQDIVVVGNNVEEADTKMEELDINQDDLPF